MKCHFKITLYLLLFYTISCAQFPGAAGTAGSTAIFKDSSIFVAWGNTCSVQRGFRNIADTTVGFTSTGDSSLAIGHADGIQIVSLGDGGSAIMGFETPITNGTGFDFAVFENGFIDEFLELAFVEVSSDGINFFRFKATSNTQTDVQVGPFDYNADATLMNNLAGKYRAMYGTPFELDEMIGIPDLNVDSITYIKVIDVVGSINPTYATYDQNNNMINEHYPTPYPQGGFDLDAIGVIHNSLNSIKEITIAQLKVYPNPASDKLYFNQNQQLPASIEIIDLSGQIIIRLSDFNSHQIDLSSIKNGMYLCKINMRDGSFKTQKLMIKK